MIKRKRTLDQTEKAKRKFQVEIFQILDLCLQIPADDRILIRNRIRDGDDTVAQRIHLCKKDKNFQALQIYLRKFVLNYKKNQNKFGMSAIASREASSRRGKTPLTFQSRGAVTQSSYPNSLKSSPSQKKLPAKAQITLSKFDIEKHIESQIDKEIQVGINGQQCMSQCRGITPRDQENLDSSDFIDRKLKVTEPENSLQTIRKGEGWKKNEGFKKFEGFREENEYDIKMLLRQKMRNKGKSIPDSTGNQKKLTLNRKLPFGEKQNIKIHPEVQDRKQSFRKQYSEEFVQSSSFYYKTILPKEQKIEKDRNGKFGEFYKRIRMAIEEED